MINHWTQSTFLSEVCSHKARCTVLTQESTQEWKLSDAWYALMDHILGDHTQNSESFWYVEKLAEIRWKTYFLLFFFFGLIVLFFLDPPTDFEKVFFSIAAILEAWLHLWNCISALFKERRRGNEIWAKKLFNNSWATWQLTNAISLTWLKTS